MQEPRGASYAAGDMESRAPAFHAPFYRPVNAFGFQSRHTFLMCTNKPQPLCWATIGATMGTVCFSRAPVPTFRP